MHNDVKECKTVEKEVEEGKQRSDVLYSFKGIGVLQAVLGVISFFLGIVFLAVTNSWGGPGYLSRLGDGIWCNLFAIPAGMLSLATGANVTYCMVGWTSIFSILSSVFIFIHLFIQFSTAFQMAFWGTWGILVFCLFLITFASAQLTVSIYNSIVFTRMALSYPRQDVGGSNSLCPCCSSRAPSNFAYVMYSNINPKKHGA